jgi:hypothetical protein
MLKDLKELNQKHYMLLICSVLALFGPGFLCLFFYKGSLILSLDIFKLLLLSGSLSLPVIVLNYAGIVYAFSVEKEEDKAAPAVTWGMSTTFSAGILYIGLYVAYFIGLDFRHFTYVLLGLEGGFWIVCACIRVGEHLKQKRENQDTEQEIGVPRKMVRL